jgi:hypothetical protein
MGIFETAGIPSPDECVGVAGLSVSLVGLTLGVAALVLLDQTFPAFAVLVASAVVGWVSFIYCVVWGESR